MSEPKTGSCLCGRVRVCVSGELHAPDACHCVQCRKQSGHYFASTNVRRTMLVVTGQESITWYQSSEKIRRGFCASCGSFLFWDPADKDWTAIAMGLFDSPTDARLEKHIFVSEKGDYYDITDDVPQNQKY
jgi:hypothetical protein